MSSGAARAHEFTRLVALTSMAYVWTRMAETAHSKLSAEPNNNTEFYEDKIATANFFMDEVELQSRNLLSFIARPNPEEHLKIPNLEL